MLSSYWDIDLYRFEDDKLRMQIFVMLFVLNLCWWKKTCINDKLVNSEDMRTEAKFIESVVII